MLNKLGMRLVDDWHKAWRWLSVQALALGAALQGAWLAVPADLKASVPSKYVTAITMTILVVGLVGRFLTFTPPKEKEDAGPAHE